MSGLTPSRPFMRIALDAAAGDFGLGPNIDGAVAAADRGEVEPVLVGPAEAIRAELGKRGIAASDARFSIVDAPDVIAMAEDPAAACRARPQASVMVCAELAAKGRAAGFVSCGHSGAAMVAALWHLKRLPGVLRPAIAPALPTARGMSVLLDAGANADCKAWHLLQFAIMGSIYAEEILGVHKPRVGVLSIGEEEGKGNELVKEAIPLLKCSGLDFYGTVEGRDVPMGTTDVVVCDGFVGNVAVKLLEGTSETLLSLLRAETLASRWSKVAAWALRAPLSRLRRRMSYDEYGGAPLLGVDGNAVIAHGKSNAKAVANALQMAKDLGARGVNARITKAVEEVKASLESTRI